MADDTDYPAPQQLSRERLARQLQVKNVEELSLAQLVELVRAEPGLAEYRPDGDYQVDPRSGDRIVYNSARTRRPHDNKPDEAEGEKAGGQADECLVCEGKTTGVIDVADLSEGFTFINKNLYPILYPDLEGACKPDQGEQFAAGPEGRLACGLHLLQWTSSLHEKDWHNMPQADRVIVMQRLAALEKVLLAGDAGQPGFVSVIKNQGRLVGGSLAHSHQQIGLSNVMPRRVQEHRRFQQERGEPFSAYLLRVNSQRLQLRDYGPAVLLVPYFMRRPLEMLLLIKDTHKQYLHELSRAEIAAAAEGWHEAIRAICHLMPDMGRETAYNVITHTGPGAGLYFEFLPYTQEIGGYEQLGLYICQGNPLDTAARLREFLSPPA